MPAPQLASVQNYFFHLHCRVDFLRLREKLRDGFRHLEARHRKMRAELSRFGRKAGLDNSTFCFFRNSFESLAPSSDSYPYYARTSWIRKRAQRVEFDFECRSEADRVKIVNQLFSLCEIGIADESQREVPVPERRWLSREEMWDLTGQSEPRTFRDWNANEEAMRIGF